MFQSLVSEQEMLSYKSNPVQLLAPINELKGTRIDDLKTRLKMRGYIRIFALTAGLTAAAEPPMPVTVGGLVTLPSDGASVTASTWRVYAVTGSALSASGSVGLQNTLTESFESGDFSAWPWQVRIPPWTVESTNVYDGAYAAEASPMGIIQVQVTCDSGSVSFAYAMAAGNSGRFWFGEMAEGTWAPICSNDTGWTVASFPISAGTHTFAWGFQYSGGNGRAWLDKIQIPLPQPQMPLVWHGEIGDVAASSATLGSEQILTFSSESDSGTQSHQGHYAVTSQKLAGDDPAVFRTVTLRPIPAPEASADTYTYLDWTAAIQDTSENGATNIVGYNVYRSADGTNFTKITSQKVTRLFFTDPIPGDGEYRYALGLVYRGSPNVVSPALSGNSVKVFKDSNIDGLPDYFALAAGLDPFATDWDNGPLGDPYHVGMNNYDAWISGALPQDPSTWLRAGITDGGSNRQTVRWNGVSGRRYWVAATDELTSGNWNVVYGPVNCNTNQLMEFTDDDSPYYSQRFYRILVEKD